MGMIGKPRLLDFQCYRIGHIELKLVIKKGIRYVLPIAHLLGLLRFSPDELP